MPYAHLSKKKRLTYFAISIVAFIILAPLVASYATGYRFSDTFQFTKTGGIYIATEGKGFSILLNNKEQEVSSLFHRSFFIQNLHPSNYTLKVTKDGYHPWEKSMAVSSEKVTEGYPFNIPLESKLIEITKMIPDTTTVNASTSTSSGKEIINADYVVAKALFATTSERLLTQTALATTSLATTSKISIFSNPKQFFLYRKVALWSEGSIIFAEWRGELDATPSYFCPLDICVRKVSIPVGATVTNLDFFFDRDAFIIFSLDTGIYVTEIDGRGGRNTQPLVLGEGYDFRIDKNQVLYIKKGSTYYHLETSLQ